MAIAHLALGNAYRYCVEGGEAMSNEEILEVGSDKSQNHNDFMIGAEEMNVDGITDYGREITPIFPNMKAAEEWEKSISKT